MEKLELEQILSRIQDLPTLPAVLGRILDTVFDPESSALELGTAIAADQSLSARLLRIVNSPYYGFHRRITGVPAAVVILGFAEVRNLVLTATAFDTLDGGGPYRTGLWRHALGSALAAESLARCASLREDNAFIAGLLHDIGKVAFDVIEPKMFQNALTQSQSEQISLQAAETAVFGDDHAWSGRTLAEHWGLPTELADTIGHHHTLDKASMKSPLTGIAALADFMAYQAGYPDIGNGCPPAWPAIAGTALGVSEEQVNALAGQLANEHERIDAFLSALHVG